jgi:hypothetical protein
MTLLTALLAMAAFVVLPFLAIGLIFEMGLAMERLYHLGADVLHRLLSHHHFVW